MLHLDRCFLENAHGCHLDVAFQVLLGDGYVGSTGHKLSFPKSKVDGETLVFDTYTELLVVFAEICLFPHMLEHLVHKLVRSFEVFVGIEWHTCNLLPNYRMKSDVPSLHRANSETYNKTKVMDLLKLGRSICQVI